MRSPWLRNPLQILLAALVLGCVPPAAPARPSPAPDQELAAIEREVLESVNRARSEAGISPLAPRESLTRLARAHSQDQARSGRAEHVGSDGRAPAQRVRDAGITYRAVAENVAMNRGYQDPVHKAVEGWMRSSGHRRNILDRRFGETGVGVAVARDGALYFTQLFLEPAAE